VFQILDTLFYFETTKGHIYAKFRTFRPT